MMQVLGFPHHSHIIAVKRQITKVDFHVSAHITVYERNHKGSQHTLFSVILPAADTIHKGDAPHTAQVIQDVLGVGFVFSPLRVLDAVVCLSNLLGAGADQAFVFVTKFGENGLITGHELLHQFFVGHALSPPFVFGLPRDFFKRRTPQAGYILSDSSLRSNSSTVKSAVRNAS